MTAASDAVNHQRLLNFRSQTLIPSALPATGRITALLDYDFSSIQHPPYEVFCSFGTSRGPFTCWSADPNAAAALRSVKLSGQFPSPLLTFKPNNDGPIDWEVALAWKTELQRHQVKRPSTILGVEGPADVDEVLGMLLAWRLINENFMGMKQDEC